MSAAENNKKWLAKVNVTLKTGVLDPQGKAVLHGLQDMKFPNVDDVRMGKYIEVKLSAPTKEKAHAEVSDMAQKLLANPVMEKFSVTIEAID